jgi:hypothetical protein
VARKGDTKGGGDPARTDELWGRLVADVKAGHRRKAKPAADEERDQHGADDIYFAAGGVVFELTGTTAALYSETLGALSRETQLLGIASADVVRGALQTEIAHVVAEIEGQGESDAQDHIRDLRRSLRAGVAEWVVAAPIYGVSLKTELSTALGKTCLVLAGSKDATELLEQAREVAREHVIGASQQQFDQFVQWLAGPLSDSVRPPKLCVVARVDAVDSSRAFELGMREIEDYAAMVRAFRFAVDRSIWQGSIGLAEDAYVIGSHVALFSRDGYVGGKSTARDTGRGFALTDGVFQTMLNAGWGEIASVLGARRKMSSWDRSLVNGLAWFGRGLAVRQNSVALVIFATALEMVLCQETDGERISSTLADRVAFLLGTDSGSRRRLSKDAKALYDLRSSVVHSGEAGVGDQERHDAAVLTWMVLGHLVLERNRIASFDQLVKVCVDRKFA